MDIQKDLPHTAEWRRSWGFLKSRTRRLFAYLAYYAFLSSVSLAYAGADEFVACPAVSSSTRVYSADRIYRNSIVSIERGDADQTITLSIYRPGSSGCEKAKFAKYSMEGGAPNIDSIFFMNLKGRPNIFTIVHWNVNSRGVGAYGKYYQVYAYFVDAQGRLVENRSVVDNSAMTGMDGYQEGRESSFPYKTAGAVKSFVRCHEAKCK